MNNKFLKNKNIDHQIYFNMVAESGCEIPVAVDEQNVNIRLDGTVGTITTDGSSPKHNNRVIVNEPFIVASRGRNPMNPSDRTTGSPTEQRLEPNSQGLCNTLTTVQKDNYVVEPPQLRIRKLTPKECWRLMGFTDDDFVKAEKVNSNTQLYKQAGNSIVVPVLEGILGNLHSCSYL
jgi:site-specific DNA-cytosine methylase